jgi:hypothetical protein
VAGEAQGEWKFGDVITPVRKRHFLRHLYIKCIILPRQARDKHRENSKEVPFSQDDYATHCQRWLEASKNGLFEPSTYIYMY